MFNKKGLIVFLMIVLLASCAPSPEEIATQTAVASTQTAAAWTPTPLPTPTPPPPLVLTGPFEAFSNIRMTEDTETDEGIDDAFDAQNRFLSTNQTISMAFNLNFDLLTEDQNLFLSAVVLDEKDQVIVTTPLFNLENGYLTFYKGQVEIRNAYTTGGIRYIAVPLSGDGLSLAVGNYQTEVQLNDEVIGNLYWVIE